MGRKRKRTRALRYQEMFKLSKELKNLDNKNIIKVDGFFRKLANKAKSQGIDSINKDDKKELQEIFRNHFKGVTDLTFKDALKELRELSGEDSEIKELPQTGDKELTRAKELSQQKVDDFKKLVNNNISKLPVDEITKNNINKSINRSFDTFKNRDLKTVYQTESTNFANEARKELGNKSSIVTGYEFWVIDDDRLTDWCRPRKNMRFKKESPEQIYYYYTPAIHYNCRSLLSYITSFDSDIEFNTEEELLNVPEPFSKLK